MSLDLSLNYSDFKIGMDKAGNNAVYEFDRFRLDAGKLMLYCDEVEVSMPPKMVKTLVVLVESSGTIISKDELLERVWSDTIVDESNLSQHLYHLRKVLGELPDGRPYIETLRRRGYRFTADVKRVAAETTASRWSAGAVNAAGAAVEREGNVLRIVDWNRPAERSLRAEAGEVQSAPAAELQGSALRTWGLVFGGVMAIVVIAMIAGVVMYRGSTDSSHAVSPEISVVRLTNAIRPVDAAISPNGDYFAYHEVVEDGQRLWLHQVGQVNRVQIGFLKDNYYGPKTFSPDGTSLFYLVRTSTDDASLYRAPALGGNDVKVMDRVSSPPSFSPDGREFVVLRDDKKAGTSSIVVAKVDGSGERPIVRREGSFKLAGTPAWSPDGTSIVFAAYETDNKVYVYATDPAGASVNRLSPENWDNAYRIVWLSDGSGILMLGTRGGDGYTTRRNQVYLISYPNGESRRLTTDGNWHQEFSLGVTKHDAILSIPINRSAQIWSIPSTGESTSALQISRGLVDGRAGVAPVPDGKIGFISRSGEAIDIWRMNDDGSSLTQISGGELEVVEELRADPKGRFFIFSGYKNGSSQLYRCDLDGENLTQLTFGDSQPVDSTISPDGEWIVYASDWSDGKIVPARLYRIPIMGGEPERVGEVECGTPNYSPDGDRLSCVRDEKIIVLSVKDGSVIANHKLMSYATVNSGARWTPQGRELVYIRTDNKSSNLWVQPLDGQPARPLTDFTYGQIYNYAYSFDGTKLFVSRGLPITDALLIQGFR
jgi:Tol biopolymer transport system component/DNA-binding winged helix-turn-helix (wHTH) protein